MSRLASWLRRAELEAEHRERVRAALDAGEEPPPNPCARGDARRMRGVPIVARGVRGAVAQSEPSREVIRRESK